jgi:hypothetical protein
VGINKSILGIPSFIIHLPPLYFKGYPVLYLRGIGHTNFVEMALPPGAYPKLKRYSISKAIVLADGGGRDINGGAHEETDSKDALVFWSCLFHDN